MRWCARFSIRSAFLMSLWSRAFREVLFGTQRRRFLCDGHLDL
jgi:hypothetical protein